MSHPPHDTRRRTSRTALAVAAALVTALAGAACSSTKNDTATTTTTAAHTSATGLTQDECVSRTPGEVMTADEAKVLFDATQICPTFVTINPGTQVTFDNRDPQSHTVTILAGASQTGQVLEEHTLEPGTTWVRAFPDAGQYTFKVDHFPSIGVVQVEPVNSSAASSSTAA
jgi:plastocyanin